MAPQKILREFENLRNLLAVFAMPQRHLQIAGLLPQLPIISEGNSLRSNCGGRFRNSRNSFLNCGVDVSGVTFIFSAIQNRAGRRPVGGV
jgi:hypothetical protein